MRLINMKKSTIISPWHKRYEEVTYKNKKKNIPVYSRKILPLTYKYYDCRRRELFDIIIQIEIFPIRETQYKWVFRIGADTNIKGVIAEEYSNDDLNLVFKSAKDAKAYVMKYWEFWLRNISGVMHYSKLYLHVDH